MMRDDFLIEDEDENDIASDVLPAAFSDKAVPIELDTLQPWHRPRKQFVRKHQWLKYASDLINRVHGTHWLPSKGTTNSSELKYLSLPGIDYLDARMLGELCMERGIQLTQTGFLAGSEKNPYVARAEIREASLIEAGFITMYSQTMNRRLEEISHGGSPAYNDMTRRGPFHIVNIDACTSLSPASKQSPNNLINAIYKIVEFQLSACKGRWLLFVTTDLRVDTFDSDTLVNLCAAIEENAKRNADFESQAIGLLGQENDDIKSSIEKAKRASGHQFIKLVTLGLTKWLLHLAESKGWQLKSKRFYCYSTDSTSNNLGPTMPALAFEFIPPPPGLRDIHGVATVAAAASAPPTEDFCITALQMARDIVDLDMRMLEQPDLAIELASEMEALLIEAGYKESAIEQLSNTLPVMG